MSATTPPAEQVLATSATGPSRAWIQSVPFDLAFFVLVPLVTLPIIVVELLGFVYVTIFGFMLTFAHYLSTFAFYFWDENREYLRTRWIAFFGGPLIITALYFALVGLRAFPVITVLLIAWNTYHVARQSCGILSIYRHRAGVFDPRQKQLANSAIIAANSWWVLWNIDTHPHVYPMLTAVSPRFPLLVWSAVGAIAGAALVRLGVGLWRRAAAGTPPRGSELAFIVASLVLFHPYLWLADSGGATYAMLLAHYVQYLGIVWLLHRRKFTRPRGSLAQVCLQRLSANIFLLVAVLGTVTVSLFAVKHRLVTLGHAEAFEAFYLLAAFLHFYLDALFWAFKDPHVRRMLAPYLMRGAVPAT